MRKLVSGTIRIVKENTHKFTTRQLIFQELFIGTLIYAVVLGFFNDYTDVVVAKSFSTIFFASFVLELLTYLVFKVKGRIVAHFKSRPGRRAKIAMGLLIWLVMFSSKFLFIWILNFVFEDYIAINGFFGILVVVLAVTIIHKLAYLFFNRLGEEYSR